MIIEKQIIFRIIGLSVMFLFSCRSTDDNGQKARTETVCRFLECLKNDDVNCVNNMLEYQLKKTFGITQEKLEFDVNKASGILQEYGIPVKDSFLYDRYPNHANELYYINVPIVINHNYGTLLSATIKIGFLRRLGDDIIADYDIDTEYKKSVIAPR